MKNMYTIIAILSIIVIIFGLFSCFNDNEKQLIEVIKKQLPAPIFNGVTLFKAYQGRKTSRSFSDKQISMQVLSNLLWAGNGINRPDSGKRTAPSAFNLHIVDLYVATEEGLFFYNADDSTLLLISGIDIRDATGMQKFVNKVPVNIIYVADYSKTKGVQQYEKGIYASAEAGAISQNIYLYCSAEGLSTGVRGNINKTKLSKMMGLSKHQEILLAQSVGYPEI